MEPLAHSAESKRNIQPQPYAAHVRGVVRLASHYASEMERYRNGASPLLVDALRLAAEFHDLGKLDPDNQAVLRSGHKSRRLPINHVDAGVAHLFSPKVQSALPAALVYSHHRGLPDFQDERLKGTGKVFRDIQGREAGGTVKSLTDLRLRGYLAAHDRAVGSCLEGRSNETAGTTGRPTPLLWRMALSCLVDADHSDTSRHYGHVSGNDGPSLDPGRRLVLLDEYVSRLGIGEPNSRNTLRSQVYQACRNADPHPGFYACDSPVGTGKTTAVMAHLLQSACARGLRRVFVVLPFTNIIDQSVGVYRKALTSPGEAHEQVVAAHHHRAEFEHEASRHLSFTWKAPVVVTTAVQFFETLAENRTSSLRKLHEVPGSAIFIDEAHATLPSHLWPQAWRWLCELEAQWGCRFVLGSGSLNRFWELDEFSESSFPVPELTPAQVRSNVSRYECSRVNYRSNPDALGTADLLEWTSRTSGPRMVIVNTVQSAAAVAQAMAESFGRPSVEHVSTSLCPYDRKVAVDRVKKRLKNRRDREWTLVATSCVEAGINFSFRNGFRERCSLNSLIQVGGRVNREGEYRDSEVWDFVFQRDGFLREHPAFEVSARILGELFEEGKVAPEHSTEAMRREIRQQGLKAESDLIMKAERNLQFPAVAEKFTVIDSATVPAIVCADLVEYLKRGESAVPEIIQQYSVQIWGYRQQEWALGSFSAFPGLYYWTLLYDDFLGYMWGVLDTLRHQREGTIE
ncbi:MAG: DEAD/DEAH box helicase [Thermodesulfobacteriota bacterium]